MLGAFRRVRRRSGKRWRVSTPHLVFLGVILAVILSSVDFGWMGNSRRPGRLASYPFGSGLVLAGSCPPPNPCGYWDGKRWHCACGGGGHKKPPKIKGTLNCSKAGNNGWCIGTLALILNASDPQGAQVQIHGDVDGTAFACQNGDKNCSIPLPEGSGTAHYKVTSSTGLSSSKKSKDYQRDSTSPMINGSLSGTNGANGWYVSNVQVGANASDTTSGLASLEYSLDGRSWTSYSGALILNDGKHTIQFRAADKAGNTTTTNSKTYQIDTDGPEVELPSQWTLGQTVTYTVQDDVSGLGPLRVVIQDPDWRWPKRVTKDHPEKDKFLGSIDWDGEFGDGTVAPPGTYQAWVKAVDGAGNETRQLGYVTVPQKSITSSVLPVAPTLLPKESIPGTGNKSEVSPTTMPTQDEGSGTAVKNTSSGKETGKTTLGPSRTTSFSAGGVSTAPKAPVGSNILWGSAAAAAIGAFAAEAERNRQRRLARWRRHLARVARWAGRKEPMGYRQIAKAYQASLVNFRNKLKKQGASDEQADALRRQAVQNGSISSVEGTAAAAVEQNRQNEYYAQARGRAETEARQKELEEQRALRKEQQIEAAQPEQIDSDYTKLDSLHADMGNISQAEDKPWWVPAFSMKAAKTLVRSIPSTGITDGRQEIPIVKFLSPEGILSFGHVTTSSAGSKASPYAEISPDGEDINGSKTPSISVGINPGSPAISESLRFPSSIRIEENGIRGSFGYSMKASVKWEGWNTTISVDLNYADVNVSTGNVGVKGNMTRGLYLKWKPMQVAAVSVGVLVAAQVIGAVAVGYLLTPEGWVTVPAIPKLVQKTLQLLKLLKPSAGLP